MAEKEDAPLIDLNEASIKKLISKAKKRGYVTYDDPRMLGTVAAIEGDTVRLSATAQNAVDMFEEAE